MIQTYVMRRPSRIGTAVRGRDEPVPEAHLWRLTEGMVRSGRLREVEMAEGEFMAAVERFCPSDAPAISAKLHLSRFSPGRVGPARTETVLVAPAAPLAEEQPALLPPPVPKRRGRPPKQYAPGEEPRRRPRARRPVAVGAPVPLDS